MLNFDDNYWIDIIVDIKFCTPIIRNIVFDDTLAHSSTLVITSKFIHRNHPFNAVFSWNYG